MGRAGAIGEVGGIVGEHASPHADECSRVAVHRWVVRLGAEHTVPTATILFDVLAADLCRGGHLTHAEKMGANVLRLSEAQLRFRQRAPLICQLPPPAYACQCRRVSS